MEDLTPISTETSIKVVKVRNTLETEFTMNKLNLNFKEAPSKLLKDIKPYGVKIKIETPTCRNSFRARK